MRISPARISDRRRPPAFTLVELLLVLALLSVVMLLAVPAFQSLLQSTLQQEVNRLTGVIRLLRNEAVLGNTRYRLMLYLKENRYYVERQDAYGSYETMGHPQSLAPHVLPAELKVDALVLLGRTYRDDEPEALPVIVDASGYVDPFLLHFTYAETRYTLRVSGFTGKVELEDGYAEH